MQNILKKKGIELLMKEKNVDPVFKDVRGYAEDIKRDLLSKGLFLPSGDFDVVMLKEAL